MFIINNYVSKYIPFLSWEYRLHHSQQIPVFSSQSPDLKTLLVIVTWIPGREGFHVTIVKKSLPCEADGFSALVFSLLYLSITYAVWSIPIVSWLNPGRKRLASMWVRIAKRERPILRHHTGWWQRLLWPGSLCGGIASRTSANRRWRQLSLLTPSCGDFAHWRRILLCGLFRVCFICV